MSLGERLLQTAHEARETAKRLPPGVEQARQLKRAREAEAIADLDQFLKSPVLKRPGRNGPQRSR